MEPPAQTGTLRDDLRELLICPRELWLTCAALVIEYVGIYSFLVTLPLWLTSDFAMSDAAAGDWSGYWSVLVTLFVFFVGSIADSFGVRRTLVFSLAAATLCRLFLSLVHDQALAGVGLFFYAFA